MVSEREEFTSSSETMAEEKMDHTHPLYLHPSDTPGSILVPVQLKGSENYGLWRISMKLALQAKRKLGFGGNYAGMLGGDTKRSSEKRKNNHFTEDHYKQSCNYTHCGRVRGIGKESEGLYVIKDNKDAQSKKVISNTTTREQAVVDGSTWHKRLGHASVSTIKNVKYLQNKVLDIAVNTDFPVCPIAKQSRLAFPRSVTRSESPLCLLRLLHMDVWGP